MESKVHHTSGDVSGRRVKGTHLAPATITSPHRTPSLLLSSVLTLSQSAQQYSVLTSAWSGEAAEAQAALLHDLEEQLRLAGAGAALDQHSPARIVALDIITVYCFTVPHCTCWWAGGRRGAGGARGRATRAPGTGRTRGGGRGRGRGGAPPGVGTMVAVFGC